MSIAKRAFGCYEGQAVEAYTLTNSVGASVTILTCGGILNRILVPDRNGVLGDVVCGFDTMEDYIADAGSYTGALIGRYGNRIGGGGFSINGVFYPIRNNEGGVCHLHGGVVGFNRKIWAAEPQEGEGEDRLVLTLFSPDGEEGYPGNLNVKVTYTFDDASALTIQYEAVSDRDTVLNMTNHAYFNLNGYDGGSVMEQELYLDADRYDAVDELLLPIGDPVPVDGTPFDFRTMHPIAVPFDHSFVLNGEIGCYRKAGEAYDPASGRTLTLYTDMPAVQLYTGVFMDGATKFKGGVPQRRLHAFCLETQYSPNTPNRPTMPSCLLRAGERYHTKTTFAFGVRASAL
ncbi:MAG: galactose mutarotase [Ruminococcaceae bacterium]|nr:galactose mutarotase [Oscillospiraceae bacterium]